METICAYVRENTAEPRFKDENAIKPKDKYQPPRVDIQAALTILGRRGAGRRAYERLDEDGKMPYELDLRNSNLQHADLTKAEFANAMFADAKLQGACFRDSDLTGAQLDYADLTEAWLLRAKLTEVEFYRTILTATDFEKTTCNNIFTKSTDFSESQNLTQGHVNQMFGDRTTTLPDTLTKPAHWQDGDVKILKLHELWRDHIAKNTP